jgi:hypothetical protein
MMKILLTTPPLTQLNTPYPATAYLTGFLSRKGIDVVQSDLGIELINRMFCESFIETIFAVPTQKLSANARKIYANHLAYAETIDVAMNFLRGADSSLATRICNTDFLPRAGRFDQLADMEWAFGTMGFTDQARHLVTLYIEDLTDYIREAFSPHFSLNRYAEHLSLYAPCFTQLEKELKQPLNIVDELMLNIFDETIKSNSPSLVGFSIPFPGNLYGALRCGQFLKANYPHIKIVWGGGYVSTELRQLSDARVFDYVDYITLDDGEPSILKLISFLENKITENELHKTLFKDASANVKMAGMQSTYHIPFDETAWPSYKGLPLDKYLSMTEVANPMHKLWSDGRWNKLTLAHGCYWAKCAFCDTSLPYISEYEPLTASAIADRMEDVIKQTGCSGFHFVDEAAPPKILRELSLEIIHRRLAVSWWTNIRFEKAFTKDLCALMAKAGCIAVSGGIEVASDRLLLLMNKGVTVEQATLSATGFTESGIMVHAYLMYGFPTQTVPETIDALETIRQMFEQGLIQSAFWHRYAMTIHSPSGKEPSLFGARCLYSQVNSFANNEIPFTDGRETDFDSLGDGLRKATYNYMHGLGFDWSLQKWFEKKMPKPGISPNYIRNLLIKNGW